MSILCLGKRCLSTARLLPEHSRRWFYDWASAETTTIAEALTLCVKSNSLSLGTQIHARIIKLGFSNDTFSLNNLIKMYSGCGSLVDALQVFDVMPVRNLVSWTLFLSGAARSGHYGLALEVFLDMMRDGFVPNEFALGSVTKACTGIEAERFGLCIHCLALKVGADKNPFVGGSILHMYAKLGFINDAERVFESMDSSDTGCWNAMVGGYAQCGFGFKAMKTVYLMHCKGMFMDNFTFVNALRGCLVSGDLAFGRQLHGLIVQSKMERSVSVMNALMDMYFKNDDKGQAMKIFNKMNERDVVSWNTVFASFGKHEDTTREVTTLINKFMATSLKPNALTFSILFRFCGEALKLDLGLQLLSVAFGFGFHGEASVASALISMFSRCGTIEMARLVFDYLHSTNINNWNEMISGYNLNGNAEALKLFHRLRSFGVEANECTFSCALEACCKTGNLQMGRVIHGITAKSGFLSNGYVCSSFINVYSMFQLLDDAFRLLHELPTLDIVSWSTMVSVFVDRGFVSEAMNCLIHLKRCGVEPDEFMLGSILKGVASYRQTESLHALVIKTRHARNVFVCSAVIDGYAKLGDIGTAKRAFDQSIAFKDVVLCNTMITAYAHHGLVMEALELFEKMKLANLKPTQATFVSIMSACSHMGLVDQGRSVFKSMTVDYAMEPVQDVYGCLVDLLSRNGFLQDAKRVIEEMPYEPWPAMWRSLLNGCRIHGDRELGEWVAGKLLDLVPSDDAAYDLLAKVHSEQGDWDGSAKVRMEMVDRGIRKSSGYSCVQV